MYSLLNLKQRADHRDRVIKHAQGFASNRSFDMHSTSAEVQKLEFFFNERQIKFAKVL
jgi:hypothetical protein